jgi:hypothetical protein
MKIVKKETLHIIQTIIEQNYFQFNQQYCKQISNSPTDGIAGQNLNLDTLCRSNRRNIQNQT